MFQCTFSALVFTLGGESLVWIQPTYLEDQAPQLTCGAWAGEGLRGQDLRMQRIPDPGETSHFTDGQIEA